VLVMFEVLLFGWGACAGWVAALFMVIRQDQKEFHKRFGGKDV